MTNLVTDNKPIRDALLGIYHTQRYCLTSLDLKHAANVQQIYEKCGVYVTGKQQVLDTVKKLHSKGLLKKLQEGRHVSYYRDTLMTEDEFKAWVNEPVVRKPRGRKPGSPYRKQQEVVHTLQQPSETINKVYAASTVPEITVTDDAIVILHAKCKITVQFTNS